MHACNYNKVKKKIIEKAGDDATVWSDADDDDDDDDGDDNNNFLSIYWATSDYEGTCIVFAIPIRREQLFHLTSLEQLTSFI